MKVGVISDTHLGGFDRRLEEIFKEHFSEADLILHAGDIVELPVLEIFKGKEVVAVSGNMDQEGVRAVLPRKRLLTIGEFRIGLIHGWGSPVGIEDRLKREFEEIHCLVYGHTHSAVNEMREGVYYFNPGSPTDGRFTGIASVGMLEIGNEIKGKIISV